MQLLPLLAHSQVIGGAETYRAILTGVVDVLECYPTGAGSAAFCGCDYEGIALKFMSGFYHEESSDEGDCFI